MNNLSINIVSAGVGAISSVWITHPIDLFKTKIQMTSNKNASAISLAKSIYQTGGMASFYRGIVPAIFRESTYTTLRIGLYEPVKKLFDIKPESNFFLKFLAGSLSGLIGSVVGNPFDVMKIQSIGSKEPVRFTQIAKQVYSEGNLYKGLQANLLRACVLNGTKMSCYDQIKNQIGSTGLIKSELPIQFTSSFVAGFVMACTVTPFDMIRTKLMSQTGTKSETVYECVSGIIKTSGFAGLYGGFIPIWLRFAPATCLQLVIYDQTKLMLSIQTAKNFI